MNEFDIEKSTLKSKALKTSSEDFDENGLRYKLHTVGNSMNGLATPRVHIETHHKNLLSITCWDHSGNTGNRLCVFM